VVTRFAVTGVPAGGTIAGKATLGPPLPAADIRSSGSISGVAAMPGGEIWTVGSQNGALNNDNRYSHADLRLFQTLAFPQNTSAPQISGSGSPRPDRDMQRRQLHRHADVHPPVVARGSADSRCHRDGVHADGGRRRAPDHVPRDGNRNERQHER